MAEQSQHLVTEEALTKDKQEFHLTTTQLEVLPFATISVSIQASQVSFVLVHDWIQQLAQTEQASSIHRSHILFA